MTDGEVRGEAGGPRAWVVLLATGVAAALVIGGIFGYLAWQEDDEDAEPSASAPSTAAPETTAEGDEAGGNQLFRRTTDEGIEVRARLTNMQGGGIVIAGEGGVAVAETLVIADPDAAPTTTAVGFRRPDDDRPAWCNVVGDLTAWAIGPDSVVQGGAPWTEEVPDGLFPGLMWDGAVDVDSVLGVVLQVGDDIESVRLTGPGGAVDEMTPVEGAVALAVPVAADLGFNPWDGRGGGLQESGVAVVARRVDGSSLRATADAMMMGHPAWSDPQCVGEMMEEPMPVEPPELALPEPGSEQPADPAAARAQIEENFAALYGRQNPDGDQLIDDNYGLDAVREQIDANGFGDEAQAATVEIHELVFPTATDAVFSYTLQTPTAAFAGQIGRARLVDDVWKITRATLCQDMNKAGGTCPP